MKDNKTSIVDKFCHILLVWLNVVTNRTKKNLRLLFTITPMMVMMILTTPLSPVYQLPSMDKGTCQR